MKKLIYTIVLLIVMLGFVGVSYGFYLYWPPNESSSSYKIYKVVSSEPILLSYLDEVAENRFNVEGYINSEVWTYFAVSNCCGADCGSIFTVVGIMVIADIGLMFPAAESGYYTIEVKLIDPIIP